MNITTKEFLSMVYEPLIKTGDSDMLSKLYLGFKGSRERTMSTGRIDQRWKNMSEIDSWVKEIENYTEILPHNINYTVAPRTKPDAKKRYVAGSCCFWVDIDDFLFYEWKSTRYPKLIGTWMEPNLLVDSGWGVHLYWLFDSFVSFADSGGYSIEEEKFTKAMKILSWYTGSDFATCSPEHLMRIPGTHNCKSSPYKPTEITLVNEKRKSFKDFSCQLENGIKSILGSKDTPDIVKKTVEGLIGSTQHKNTNYDYLSNTINIKNTEATIKRLKDNPMKCNVLDCTFNNPSELGYTAWFSLGAALNKVISDRELAFEIFRLLSLPGNRSNDPENEIKRKFDSIFQVGYMPPNPSKIPECSGCPLILSGKCRNIVNIIRNTIK